MIKTVKSFYYLHQKHLTDTFSSLNFAEMNTGHTANQEEILDNCRSYKSNLKLQNQNSQSMAYPPYIQGYC
jgi:hypothetical protein